VNFLFLERQNKNIGTGMALVFLTRRFSPTKNIFQSLTFSSKLLFSNMAKFLGQEEATAIDQVNFMKDLLIQVM
jgi:hypothetical protein